MGSWNSDPFGNDTAGDWSYDLEKTNDLSLIKITLKAALDTEVDYLEAPIAEQAIAAAEVLARLKGKYYVKNAYTACVDKWVEKHPLVPAADLIADAKNAIARILTPPSELLELWQDSDEFENWKLHLDQLIVRLS